MKKRTANILIVLGYIGGFAGAGGGIGYFCTTHKTVKHEWVQLENRVHSLEDELKGDYNLKFKDPKANEFYQKAVQQEYVALKPEYDKIQPELKAAQELSDKHLWRTLGLLGVAVVSFGVAGVSQISRNKED